MAQTPRTYAFDARVVRDHFPGIGRHAWNLLRELIAHLEADERLVVLYDPNARSSRHPLHALAQQASPRVAWRATPTPIFSTRNLFLAADPQWALVHYPYYVRPLALKARSITTLYDAIPFRYPAYFPARRTRLAIRLFHWLAVLRAQRIIVPSEHARQELAELLPAVRSKSVVIPAAADPHFQPMSAAEAHATLAPRFGALPPFCLYLASNKPHKNLPRLVEAWRLVVNALGAQAPLLVIAGHYDPRYPEAQQRVRALGLESQVRFIGTVSDVEAAALYASCELFIYPSLHEGFGLTPLEAMACGAPVACASASSLPEVVGEAALLFDPTDVDDIARACLVALRDPSLRARLREASLKQAARFSWARAAQQTLAVYREVAEKHR